MTDPRSSAALAETSTPTFPEYEATDLANAEKFARLHGHHFHYVPAWRRWIAWDGQVWRADDRGLAVEAAKSVARELFDLALATSGADFRALAAHARATASASRIAAMLDLARSEPG
ncbi:MAG: hypothetical protein PHQ53_04580, partial [Candidatus Krumholzibacteria bacterium]|nr:hypothetical protein [Candidatus Krumholzibacteria bacterium]